jgi:hypothetical protein
MRGLDVFDWALLVSLAVNAVLAVLHIAAGVDLYVRDVPAKMFAGDLWKPATPKQRILLGSYFALSFAWLQVAVLMSAMLLVGNPLGPWLGAIGLVSFGGQVASMRGNDPVAAKGLVVHLVVLLIWTAAAVLRRP